MKSRHTSAYKANLRKLVKKAFTPTTPRVKTYKMYQQLKVCARAL